MKMYTWAFLLLNLGLSFVEPAVAQTDTKKNVAVIDIETGGGLSKSEVAALSDRLRSMLVKTKIFNVIERGKMDQILKEVGFQQTGCTTTECAVEIGKMLNVQQMVTGSINKIGNLYTVDISMIDVQTAQIRESITKDYRGEIEGLVGLLEPIANQLAGIKTDIPPKIQSGIASWSGTVTLNFDSITRTGCVDATGYFGSFGVTITQQSVGTTVSMGAAGQCFHGDVVVPSPPNALYVPNNQPVSFTLNFDRALSRINFTRARLNAGPSGVNTIGWSATAFDAQGNVLDRIYEDTQFAYSPNYIAAAYFKLSGTGIRSVTFVRITPSGQNTSFGVSFAVLDDFVLTE